MGSSSKGENYEDVVNLNKRRRVYEGNEGGDSEGKKFKILGRNDEECGVVEESGNQRKERIEKGEMGFKGLGFGEEMNLNPKEVSCCGGLYTCEEKRMDYDLNVAVIDSDSDHDMRLPIFADRNIEIIDIPSEDSEDESVVEEFDLVGLGLMEGNFAGKICVSDGKRYSKEEKGKAKVVDSWLSLTTSLTEFELQQGSQSSINFHVPPGSQELVQFDAKQGIQDSIDFELQLGSQESFQFDLQPGDQDSINGQLLEIVPESQSSALSLEAELRRAEYSIEMERHRHLVLQRRARRLARSEGYGEASSSQEKASAENDSLLGKLPGPFSDALKMVRDRKSQRNEQLIAWKPSGNGCNPFRPPVPSLLDLSLKVLAENAVAILSLELVPDFLRRRLADTICNLRGMNIHTFELFVKGSPTEIWIRDSSWLTQEQFLKTFRNFDANNLTVLQLELCGQCTLDDHVITETLAWSSMSLPNLQVLSLKGACRLSDDGLKAILTSAPLLKSINLSQCSLLTNDGIHILANTLGSMLRELYIDDCQKIDPILILPALKKFEYLEVLSVAGIQTVCDQFVIGLIAVCGKSMKELDLADCLGLTNSSLQIIGDTCTGLRSLNISNLDKLTDLGLQYLADGCRYIETLKLCRNNFSDEAIAAFLEASGQSMKELSLNNVTLVGPCTAFSLAKCSTKLLKLDLSWCRKITDEALGSIVDSCLSLKLIKLFGCSQISNVFSKGHSNPQVQIIGLQLTPILESANVHEPLGVI